MDSSKVLEIIHIGRSEFSLLFGDETTINILDASEEATLTVYGEQITLPPVKITQKEKRQDESWLVTFTCLSADENKKCFWTLRLCQPQATSFPSPQELLPKRHLYAWSEKDRQKRLAFLRKHTGHSLISAASTTLKAETLKKNIEGFIGSVEIPVGIAGPLRLKGDYTNDIVYAPVATTEGALIASISRGANAITQSGGAVAQVLDQRMMRVPRFQFNSVRQCRSFAEWAEDHLIELRQTIALHSRFARLLKLEPHIIGNAVHMAFIYQTAEAAGQNMTTVCTWHACQWIKLHLPEQLKPEHFILESNLSSDKKCSWQTFSQGRGTRVIAETRLTEQACRLLLRLKPEELVRAWHWLSEGATAAGMTGMNINTANVIAGMFTALGQDIACNHESALSQLQMSLMPDNSVYCSITLPALVIGTVGGGTALPDQADYLRMLGCKGENSTGRLAEIIAGFCLALDISTLAALANDEFARSHQLLGRNRKIAASQECSSDPFIPCFCLATYTGKWQGQHPIAFWKKRLDINKNSILTENCEVSERLPRGIFPYTLRWQDNSELEVVLKNKPSTQTIMAMLYSLAERCSPSILQHLKQALPLLEFNHARKREIALLQQTSPRFTRYVPTLYGIYQDEEHGHDIIIEELLTQENMLNSFPAAWRWQSRYIHAAITGIADIHSIWYRQEDALKKQLPLVSAPDTAAISMMTPLWLEIGSLIHHKQPELFPLPLWRLWSELAATSAEHWHEIESMPRTLVHNDFNPRNIAFRQTQHRLCCWDWELATLHLPQHDLAELLTYTLDENIGQEEVLAWVNCHREALERSLNAPVDPQQWYQGYRLALYDFGLRRLSLYLMFNHISPLEWFPDVMKTFTRLVTLAQENPSLTASSKRY